MAGALAVTLPPVSATAADEPDDDVEGLSGLLAGLRAVACSPMLRGPFAVFAGLLLLEGTTDVQLVALSLGKLHMGSSGPGVLTAVWGVGGLLGSALILLLVRRRGYGLALAAGSIVFAGGLALAAINVIPIAIGAMIPAGIGFALVEIAVMALVPRLADDAIVGRVYALSEVLYAGAAGVGALIAPTLISALGVDGSLAAVGIAFGVGAIAAQPHVRAARPRAGAGRACARAAARRELSGATAPSPSGAARARGTPDDGARGSDDHTSW